MNIKKLILLIVFATAAFAASAQEWIQIVKTNDTIFFVQPSSIVLTENDSKNKVIAIIGKTIGINSNKIDVVIWYVTVDDCMLRRGKLQVLDANGKWVSQHDFSFGSKKISDFISELICSATQETRSKKPNLITM